MSVEAVLDGSERWHVVNDDALAVLRGLPDGCVDAVVCDPPYELSDGGKASPARVAAEVLLPKNPKLDPGVSGECELEILASQIARLAGIGRGEGPSLSVPVSTVTLDEHAPTGDVDVEYGEKQARGIVSDLDAGIDGESESAEYVGRFTLKCADPEAFVDALARVGTCYCSGRLGVWFGVGSASGPCLSGSGLSIVLGNKHVGFGNDSNPLRVGANLGAENHAMLALVGVRGASTETLSAVGALALLGVFKIGGAQLVQTHATAGRLPAELEPCCVRYVVRSAHGALAFDLLIHAVNITTSGFMGRAWDGSKIAFDVAIWREALRVLKPGGHCLAFGGTRTYHRMVCAIEDAGFEIRDSIHWIYATGFPKSLDVSKAIDAELGAEPIVVGERKVTRDFSGRDMVGEASHATTIPATIPATAWQGWGTALKPAHEPIVVARKPLGSTVAECVLANGTGGLNVDACRLGTDGGGTHCSNRDASGNCLGHHNAGETTSGETFHGPDSISGRWPPNLLFGHSPDCVCVGTRKVDCATAVHHNGVQGGHVFPESLGRFPAGSPDAGYASPDGTETIPSYRCAPNCPVRMLDEQSGIRPGMSGGGNHAADYAGGMFGAIDCSHTARNDTGAASRFFPCFTFEAKASRGEREAGCEDLPAKSRGDITGREDDAPGCDNPRSGNRKQGEIRNIHPTVKPISLMKWLVRLVIPPGGVVLDCFAGSGSTGCAAVAQGFRFIGCDLLAEHVAIARARIAWWQAHPGGITVAAKEEAKLEAKGQVRLFG